VPLRLVRGEAVQRFETIEGGEGQIGDVIEVLSSDEGSATDIPAWVAKAQHEMVDVIPEDGFRRFVIRKAR